MKIGRCPVCHHQVSVEAIAQDEAASELLKRLAKLSVAEATSCLSYLALFRPAKSDLNNGRALRLLDEILSMTPNKIALCSALDATSVQITQSRLNQSETKPLSNHNYLLKVLKSIPGWDLHVVDQVAGSRNEIIKPNHRSDKESVESALLDLADRSWADNQ